MTDLRLDGGDDGGRGDRSEMSGGRLRPDHRDQFLVGHVVPRLVGPPMRHEHDSKGGEGGAVSARREDTRREDPRRGTLTDDKTPGSSTWGFSVERVTRIELALSAWEADVLPLNYTRVSHRRPRSGGVGAVAHCTSSQAPGVQGRGPPCVPEGGGCGCGGPELGRTVEGSQRGCARSECRLERRPFRPVMWGPVVRAVQPGAALWGRDFRT